MKKRRISITELARDLRNNPTASEQKLWEHLSKKQLKGYRFTRQKPFIHKEDNHRKYFFIADFYCAKKKLVIELDGKVHDYQQYYDYQRDLVLERMGLSTLRIKNNELSEMEKVKRKILLTLE